MSIRVQYNLGSGGIQNNIHNITRYKDLEEDVRKKEKIRQEIWDSSQNEILNTKL